MIKANELRIGNWVNVGNVDIPREVEIVSDSYVCLKGNKGNYVLETFDPIPLTPEILEKCESVEKFNETEHIKSYALSIDDDNEIIISVGQQYPFIEFNGWQKQNRSFQYLHQLQNLYFALTGEELNIQL